MEQTLQVQVLRGIMEQCVQDCLQLGKNTLTMSRFRAAQRAWERAWHDARDTQVVNFGAVEEVKYDCDDT